MTPRETLAGVLLGLAVLASLAAGFGGLSPLPAGLLQLASGALLWLSVPSGVRRQSLLLVAIGAACLLLAPHDVPYAPVLSKNQQMIAMLAAIGLLRRVPLPDSAGEPPRGRRALWQTMFGVHWLGAVINISSLAIFADRLVGKDGRLGSFQGVVLARGFALAALWSPFFVAMGVALAYAPGADYLTLMLWGLPLSQLLLAGTAWLTVRLRPEEVEEFRGYPFRPATLVGPALLAASVMVGHLVAPGVSIISLITLLAPAYVLLVNRRNRPLQLLVHYVRHDLPKMGAEIVLFAAAGVLGSGLSELVAGHRLVVAGEHGHVLLAAAGLAAIVAVSCVGVHPVVGITVVGGGLAAAGLSPDLLALSFLMSWGLGVLVNPISGIHLFLSGRYAFPSRLAWRWNLRFVAAAFAAGCAWLGLFALCS